jgi:hypothetical protein
MSISGVTPPSYVGHLTQMNPPVNRAPHGLPAGDQILGPSGEIYAAILTPTPATEATAINCSNWCDWSWTARAHAGINTHGQCTTRCLYQNNATDAQVKKWGYPNISHAPKPLTPPKSNRHVPLQPVIPPAPPPAPAPAPPAPAPPAPAPPK